jgi:hypothetical protein
MHPPDVKIFTEMINNKYKRLANSGGAEGTRTLGLFVANELLSQLSYSPASIF